MRSSIKKNGNAENHQKQQSISKLQLELIHGFGSNMFCGLKDIVCILDENQRNILYPIGSFIAIKNYYSSHIDFIPLPKNYNQITCIRVSSNRLNLAIAYTSKKDNLPYLYLYKLGSNIKKNQRETIFRDQESKALSYVALSFSGNDSRFLCAATCAPENQLICLDIQRMKIIGAINFKESICRIQINPKDDHLVTLIGQNLFKNVRVQESIISTLSDIQKINQNQNFVECAWFDKDKLILCNDQGEIFVIFKNELIQYIQNGFNEKNLGIVAIECFSVGFIICSEFGKFALWIIDENGVHVRDSATFSLQRKWNGDRNHKVAGFSISRQEDLVAIAFQTNDICTFDLQSILPSTIEAIEIQRQMVFHKDVKYDYIFNGFHSGEITCIDICTQRSLIVTASNRDCTVRIWNYRNYKCALARKFQIVEENEYSDDNPLLSVAFHPNGYYLAIGFVDKIRMFHLLHTELRKYRQLNIPGCSYMKFSNGGHMLAAASFNKNLNYDIKIINSYSLEIIQTLKVHTAKVTDLQWKNRDQQLYSCGLDGIVCEWNSVNWSKREFQKSKTQFKKLTLTSENDLLVVGITRDYNTYKNFVQCQNVTLEKEDQLTPFTFEKQWNYGQIKITAISSFETSKDTTAILCANQFGELYLFQNSISLNPDQVIQTHQGEIIQILVSPDGKNAFTIGEDGSIFIFQINEFNSIGQNQSQYIIFKIKYIQKQQKSLNLIINFNYNKNYILKYYIFYEIILHQSINIQFNSKYFNYDISLNKIIYILLGNIIKQEQDNENEEDIKESMSRHKIVDEMLADVLLVPIFEIDLYLIEQKKLRNDVDDLENKMEMKLQDDLRQRVLEQNEAQKLLNIETQRWQKRYEELKLEKQRLEKNTDILLKNMEDNHIQAVLDLEGLYEKKIKLQNEKYRQLESNINEDQIQFEEKQKIFEQKQINTLNLLQQDFENKFEKANSVFTSTKETAEELRLIYEQRLEQQEDEHDEEIRLLKLQNVKHRDVQDRELNKLKNKNERLKYDNKTANDEKDRVLKNEQDKISKIDQINSKLLEAQAKISSLQKDLTESLKELEQKDKKIFEYEYTVNDLQKSKHVLTYRTAEMRKSLEPKEDQINNLQDELFKLEAEFETQLQVSRTQNSELNYQSNQIQVLQQNLKKTQENIKKKKTFIQNILMDIYECVGTKSKKDWADFMVVMYKKYVMGFQQDNISNHQKGAEEMVRQIIHLEKSIENVQVSSQKKIFRRESDIRKKTMENAGLIYDLNEIRKKNKQHDKELTLKQTQLETQQNEIQKINKEIAKYKKLEQMINYQNNNDDNILQGQNQQQKIHQQMNQNFLRPHSQSKRQENNLYQINLMREKQIKNPSLEAKVLTTFEKAKMIDIIVDNENKTNQINQMQLQIKRLVQEIKHHKNDQNCTINFTDSEDESMSEQIIQ